MVVAKIRTEHSFWVQHPPLGLNLFISYTVGVNSTDYLIFLDSNCKQTISSIHTQFFYSDNSVICNEKEKRIKEREL